MGADQNVNFAGFDFLQNFFLLLGGAKAADHFDVDGKGGKALLESFVVLERKHCSRRQCCDLLVITDCFESRAHGDLCLAVADVAAQQSVHRQRGFHVAFDIRDCERLIIGLAVLECIFEFAHPFVVRGKAVALRRLALRIKLEQLLSHVLHGLADTRLGFGPGCSSQVIQGWLGALSRAVLLDEIEAGQRNIELCALSIFEQHELGVAVPLIDFLQPLVLANAVLDVYDIVSNL